MIRTSGCTSADEEIADLKRQLEEAATYQREVLAPRYLKQLERAEKAEAQLAAMRETLQEHEWELGPEPQNNQYCPICKAKRNQSHGGTHNQCWLRDLLANSSTAAEQFLRELQAKTLRDAADEVTDRFSALSMRHPFELVRNWLRERADAIAAGKQPPPAATETSTQL